MLIVKAALRVSVRIVVQPGRVPDAPWDVQLEIPDLSHILAVLPDLQASLLESRCTVTGAAGAPLARGRVLSGSQRVNQNLGDIWKEKAHSLENRGEGEIGPTEDHSGRRAFDRCWPIKD